MRAAMHEAALTIGGENLAAEVAAASMSESDDPLPNVAAINLLKSYDQDIAEWVLGRMKEMQIAAYEERRQLDDRQPSWYARIIGGFATFRLWR